MKSYINQSRRPISAHCSTLAIVLGFAVSAAPVLIAALIVLSGSDGSGYVPFFSTPSAAQPQMADSFGGGR